MPPDWAARNIALIVSSADSALERFEFSELVTFVAQGFEHSVVNMFVIPAGMLLGAHVSAADWWLWNQLPVTLGNVAGGVIFTGLALHLTHRKTAVRGAAPALAGEVRRVLSGRS